MKIVDEMKLRHGLDRNLSISLCARDRKIHFAMLTWTLISENYVRVIENRFERPRCIFIRVITILHAIWNNFLEADIYSYFFGIYCYKQYSLFLYIHKEIVMALRG